MARMITSAELAILKDRGFVHMPRGPVGMIEAQDRISMQYAQDAQPQLLTTPNAGVPWVLQNLIDPDVIRVLFAPMKATEIFGETKKGDWTTFTAQFPIVEDTGSVASYGDYNNDGMVGANINWTSRNSYYFQTHSMWGERELDMYALGGVNYKAELDMAAALVMAKFFNKSYFFGVANVNFGALNDPRLIAPISPLTKAAGGVTWANATAQEIYNDILALYGQLLTQMGNLIDQNTAITLALSPGLSVAFNKVSQYNVTARQTIMGAFPNMTIETAPEYATVGGQLVQMIVKNFQGQQTAYGAFTEKMRAHAVVPDTSSWKQKKSGGTWGMIIRRPYAVAQMLGC